MRSLKCGNNRCAYHNPDGMCINMAIIKPERCPEWLDIEQRPDSDESYIFKPETNQVDQHDMVQPGHNNGGSTDYYKFKPGWTDCQDIIEDREMNFSQGNIFKVAFCFNRGRHSDASYIRELNKIVWFANREIERVKE